MKPRRLKVCMFGELYIEIDGTPVKLPLDIHSITAQLLVMLWDAGDKGISRDIILNRLYGENEVSDPANSMRVNIFRLRKMIKKLPLPDNEYIIVKNGLYQWDTSNVELEIDVREFTNRCQKAKLMPDGVGKNDILVEACELYKGDFLSALSAEQWAAVKTMNYQNMYVEAVIQLYQSYMKEQLYDQAIYISSMALNIYMYEYFAIMKIDAQIARGDFQKALKTLDELSKRMFSDFGIIPSDEMLRRYEQISSHINSTFTTIKEMKEQFNEEVIGGAYYCHYPSFIDCYRILKRLSVRNGQAVFLVCCSITDSQGKHLEHGSKGLHNAPFLMKSIESSLRIGDIYTRSSDNQFLILLSGLTLEDCSLVTDRINKNFQNSGKFRGIRLDFCVTPVTQPKKV